MNAQSTGETIALVSCVKKKKAELCPAKDLYVSPLFRYSRTYAEQNADRWFILSAKHELVDPEQQLEPYEETFRNTRKARRREWAEHVYEQMRDADVLHEGVSFLWLAGKDYREFLWQMLESEGFRQHDPLAGLVFGKRVQWLKRETGRS
ncbi:MAG: DUF6884 domain-containing protein [Phycisphaerae bacterium]